MKTMLKTCIIACIALIVDSFVGFIPTGMEHSLTEAVYSAVLIMFIISMDRMENIGAKLEITEKN